MFVASLNLDLFFKKVFSNKRVAKKFLEDVLGVKITDFKRLSVENKLTDAAVTVKFDFRCKIHGQYVVIEMQQKYKIDVVKRFYLYQAVDTALQLETLKPSVVIKPNGETYTEKNYSGLEPVITLIWMVDDMLGFEDDYIAYTTLPESASDFILDADLWAQPLKNILEKREKIVSILENKTKGLDFFTKNRMIYIFQKNIIKNRRIDLPYFKWFDVANMSRNPNNKEEDFLKYKDDKEMTEVLSRIRKDKLPQDEFKYVSDLYMYDIHMARMEEEHQAKMARQRKRTEKKLQAIEQKMQVTEQKMQVTEQKAEQEKQKVGFLQMKLAKNLLQQGETIASIAETLDISVAETMALLEK